MKTYSIRDWTMISISFVIAMFIAVSFSTFCFSSTERTKTLMVIR